MHLLVKLHSNVIKYRWLIGFVSDIKQDKSAYWTPQLYFQDADGTFELVPEVGHHLT